MRIADQITVMILTYNEEDNIARTLDAVRWARRVLVVDSGSTDATLELSQAIPGSKSRRGFSTVSRASAILVSRGSRRNGSFRSTRTTN